MITIRRAIALIATAAVMGLLPAGASHAAPAGDSRADTRVVRIWHAPVGPTLVQGSGLGAVRTFMVPTKVNGKANAGNYLTGTLTTVAVGLPDDQELRASNLTFVVRSQANQLVVGGVSNYPTQAGVLAIGETTTRPVVGGSGIYAGARGYVLSTNRGDAGWLHEFHLR